MVAKRHKEKSKKMATKMATKTPGFGWRISLSILVAMAWLIFIVIWLFFYASHFTIYQNIAVLLASLLAVGASMGALWAMWGMRYCYEFKAYAPARKRARRPKRKR
jgi:hypothetical protein